jgi:subtilisin family serine protease
VIPDRRRSHHARRRQWAVVALLVAGLATPGAGATAAAPGAAPATPPATAAGLSVASVTLVTGDEVRVTTRDGKQEASLVPNGSGRPGAALIQNRNGHLHVIPASARRLLSAGRLDERLFDVTALVAAGYTSGKRLPILVAAPASPLSGAAPATKAAAPTAPPSPPAPPEGSTLRRRLPSLGVTAVEVTRPDRFWTAIAGEAAAQDGSRAATALATGVGKIWLDGRVRATLDRSVPQIGGPAARARGLDGEGVTVAVLDTGIDDQNPDVAGRVAAQADFVQEGDTDDHNGHGTHVASTVAGTGANSGGTYAGVAPGSTLLDGKVLDGTGFGTDSAVLAGMEWAAPRAHVVSMSLGNQQPSDGADPLAQAVDSLTAQHGTLFVIAAGNDGPGASTVSSPGSAASALTVGAVDRDDTLADFSSRGPRLGGSLVKPEITAPGVDIVAAQADGTELGPVIAPGYVASSGTSMATPHVSGAAALLAQQHPGWTAAQLKATLAGTARPAAGTSIWNQGAGRVDLALATATPLRVDAATLDFGFHSWPHGGDAPVTRQLTYTNDGDAPTTVQLAATLTADDGTAAPAGAVGVDTPSFTLAAGATKTVTVTAAPDAVGVGRWSGVVTAATPAGSMRTVYGLVKEAEHHDVTLKAITRGGAAAEYADVLLVNAVDATDHLHVSDLSRPVRLPPGTYQINAWIYQDAEVSLVVRGDVRVGAAATVTLDARGSVPYVATVPAPDAVPQVSALGFDFVTQSGGYGISSTQIMLSPEPGERRLWARPSAPVRTGTFSVGTATHLQPPELAALTADGKQLDATPVWRDDRLDGRRTVDVVNASSAVTGRYVLARVPAGTTSLDDVVAPLAAAGAAGAVLREEESFALDWVRERPAIPVFILPDVQWQAISDAAGSGTTRLTLTGTLFPADVWGLFRRATGQVPASLTNHYRRADLARVDRTFRSHGHGGTGVAALAPALGSGVQLSAAFRHGGRRTDWLTPGEYGTTVGAFVPGNATDLISARATWRSQPVTYAAGSRTPETFVDQLSGASTPVDGLLSRYDDEVFGVVSPWTDPHGRGSGGGAPGQSVSWRLSAGGETVAEGEDPFLEAHVPAGRTGYVLDVTGQREVADGYALSTRVKGRWTFPSQRGAAFDPVPMLGLDAPLPLDAANSAPRGQAMTFTVSGRVLAKAQQLTSLSVASSADAGATWVPATVTRTGPDRFAVTVVNPGRAGTVSLRLAATAPGGLAVSEEVRAAYAVR